MRSMKKCVASSALYNAMQAVLRCCTPIGSYRRKHATRSRTPFRDKPPLIASGLGMSQRTNPLAGVTAVVSSLERGS